MDTITALVNLSIFSIILCGVYWSIYINTDRMYALFVGLFMFCIAMSLFSDAHKEYQKFQKEQSKKLGRHIYESSVLGH